MKNKLIFLFFFAFLLLSLNITCAQITLPSFNKVYSGGGAIDISFNVIETKDVTGLIKLTLNCGSVNDSFFISPISLEANEEKNVKVEPYTLEQQGNCIIKAELSGQNGFKDYASSASFFVSNRLNVSIELNKQNIDPEEILIANGHVTKADGKSLEEGTVLITLNGEVYIKAIKKGSFRFENTLSKTFSSGEQEIIFEAKDNEGNGGSATADITVSAIPTSLEININNDSFVPGDRLEAYGALYDQSEKEMQNSVGLILYDSWGIDVIEENTNKTYPLKYTFEQKSPTGEWWVYAFTEGIKLRKYITVKEMRSIDAGLNSNLLKILNTGNTAFKQPVKILFQPANGEAKTEIKEVDLGIESQKEYELSAPDGSYNITVSSDNFEKEFTDVFLTGNAVKVEDTEGRSFKTAQKIIALAVIAAIITLSVILKRKKSGIRYQKKMIKLKI